MRLQLVAAVASIALASTAYADGTISARGVYYKERATRVMQPMLDSMFAVGERGLVNAHFLVDAITSASASAGAVNAEPFTEVRYEGGGGYTHAFGDLRLNASTRYSTEPDYKSFYGGLRGELDLADKNTTLGLGIGFGNDSVRRRTQGIAPSDIECEPGINEKACPLRTYAAFASLSQIVSRRAIVSVSYDVVALRGYQANPYRQAIVGNGIAPERHPNERLRQAYAISARYYVPLTETTFIGAYRFYRDDWLKRDSLGAGAHTPELRIVQQVGDSADATLRYRYHMQYRAFFYRERYPEGATFISDDVKLSRFDTHTIEAKLGMFGEAIGLEGRWAAARIEGILTYVTQDNRFGNAIIAHAALTLPFEY